MRQPNNEAILEKVTVFSQFISSNLAEVLWSIQTMNTVAKLYDRNLSVNHFRFIWLPLRSKSPCLCSDWFDR